jgi:hypothetical protein
MAAPGDERAPEASAPAPEPPSPAARRRRRNRLIRWGILAVLAVVVLVLATQAIRAYVALREARTDVESVRQDLGKGDFAAAERHLRSLSSHASTARGASDGFEWNLIAHAPVVGDDVKAVQVMARVLDDVSGKPLKSSVALLQDMKQGAFQPRNGQFDLKAFAEASPEVDKISAAMIAADHDVDALSPDGLVPPLARAVVQVQRQFDSISGVARSAHSAMAVLPKMLGSDGPRNTLLVVQNNAEIRATGGMPGAFSLLHADDGRVTVGFQNTTSDLPPLKTPVLPLTAEEKQLFGPTMATDVRDANLTPDFPRAAQLVSAIVGRERGMTFDDVIFVDPVALSAVLKATGPISIGETKLTSANAVEKLLHDPYQRLDTQSKQDQFFVAAAKRTIHALLAGGGNPQALVRQTLRAVDAGHILVWSRHAQEQDLLDGSIVSGRLPGSTGSSPQVGMYLNDATAGKIDYFLDTDGSVYSFGCTGGAQKVTAQLDLTSSVRTDEKLSKFVTGPGTFTAPGNIALRLRIYAPAGGHLTGLTVAGKRASIRVVQHEGREVSVIPLDLPPHEHIRVLASFTGRPGQVGPPQLTMTPAIHWKPTQVTAQRGC